MVSIARLATTLVSLARVGPMPDDMVLKRSSTAVKAQSLEIISSSSPLPVPIVSSTMLSQVRCVGTKSVAPIHVTTVSHFLMARKCFEIHEAGFPIRRLSAAFLCLSQNGRAARQRRYSHRLG